MDAFLQSLKDWQLFYATVATAAAALTGLLFVSLSINRNKLVQADGKNQLSKARQTFGDFLYVLMIAFVFLVPHQVPFSLTVSLMVLGLSRGIGLTRDLLRAFGEKPRRLEARRVLRDIFFPVVASLGLVLVGIAAYFGNTTSFYWLVLVIAALLMSACWHAWLLLMEA